MKKSKRKAKAAQLLKNLPSESAATTGPWDAACSAEDYVQQAQSAFDQTKARLSALQEAGFPDEWFKTEIRRMKHAESGLYEAKFQLLGLRRGVRELLDKKNWAVERPTVAIEADVNQAGNLVLRWTTPYPPRALREGSQLRMRTEEHFNETVVSPGGPELLRFRNVPLEWTNDRHPSERYVMYAIRSKFDTVVASVAQSLDLVDRPPRLIFIQDDEERLEMALSTSQD
jgi:hypothetical protein